ncbi:hypothetical protein J7J37_01900 [bacterium]|nr:hypothetical protein [bacterium]
MVKVIQGKNLIKIGKEPVVILPLKEWEEIQEYLEEIEERERFNKAFEESRNKKGLTLSELKKKYKLMYNY